MTYAGNLVMSVAAFAATFVVIGLPLWWKTTEVYRYPIPHAECQQLVTQKMMHRVKVKLVLVDHSVPPSKLWEELLKPSNKDKEPAIEFEWTLSSLTEEKRNIFSLSKDIAELDHALNNMEDTLPIDSHGELEIFILKENFTKEMPTLGIHRHGYVLNHSDSKKLAADIQFVVEKMVQVELLQKLYNPPLSHRIGSNLDRDQMRYLRSSLSFEITFSLIVPEPQFLDVHWDIRSAVAEYVTPILEELSLVSTIRVKSQVLYMTSLPIQLSLSPDKKEHIVWVEHLPSIINPVEARLGSDTSVSPNLNFIIYIPIQEHVPLQIYNHKGVPVASNAFLLPQWGSFLIYNPPSIPENTSLPMELEMNTRTIMEVFISHLRLLLGLPQFNDSCQLLPFPGIRQWELDFLLRKNAQEQLSFAMSSLSSLSQLLQTIGNIVIRDEIGHKIDFALSSIKESFEDLKGGRLREGFMKAKAAYVSSEEAFFDPSLLALLYFPDDQKYAIYIPLFLPVSIPIATSVMQLWKSWWAKKKIKPD